MENNRPAPEDIQTTHDSSFLPGLRRWVLVAGTGWNGWIPRRDLQAAKAIGRKLAEYKYGLITGGWAGVDAAVLEAFLRQLRADGLDPREYLIQVTQETLSPARQYGHVVQTSVGAEEWLDAQKYADAVVLIGGRGGTYWTWLGALHAGIPRFPLGGTKGDAERAFYETTKLWEVIPIPGLTLAEFQELGREINTEKKVMELADYLVGNLLWKSLYRADQLSRKVFANAPSIFISYSHQDSYWEGRLRTLLRPLERKGVLATWVDVDLVPGELWESQLLARLEAAQAALLLVTRSFLASAYIQTVEIKHLLTRVREAPGRMQVFWVCLESCDWQGALPELGEFQSLGDPKTPLNQSGSLADEQVRLIQVVEALSRAMASQADRRAAAPPSSSAPASA